MSVFLIGCGPGDPGFITLKASQIIPTCTAVVYDDLIPPEILDLAATTAQKIYVGKRAGRDYMKQDRINDLLLDLAHQGHQVARLKGGDPCIFGRGGEEALFLSGHGIACQIVPGITSAIAGPEAAGIPPTHRGLAPAVTFVTAHEDPFKSGGFLDWNVLARTPGTLVFLMGAGRIAAIAERLTAEGMPATTPCALIQDATLPAQHHVITTLARAERDAAAHHIASPCIIVVGQVADLSTRIFQTDQRPLAGRQVLITRPAHLAAESARLFASQGARVRHYPLVEISPLTFTLPAAGSHDLIIFTSQNAVSLFIDHIRQTGGDARWFAGSEIVCIGPKTRDALEQHGLVADAMAAEFRAEGIFALLENRDLDGLRICLPRARGARPWLIDALRDRGALVDEIFVYETILPPTSSRAGLLAALQDVDTVVFTSPSGVRHALALLEDQTEHLRVKDLVAIGPITAKTMHDAGLPPKVSARVYTDQGIIEALAGISED